ncbi:hypothetical protein [Priestia megaterium]|uniref:hypothetical protein n=1 Tax=Priestia megaterium TaxID=1404 RepID=UPI002FFFB2BF
MTDWTMVITIIGSFGAALSAQMAANFFTNRREDKKYDKECFQNLYSPLLFRFIEYVYCEDYKAQEIASGRFNEEEFEKNSSNPEPVFKEIMEYMEENLKYAHPEIIMEYELIKISDGIPLILRNSSKLEGRIGFCREFFLKYMKLSKKLNVLSKTVENRVRTPLFFSYFYFLLNECKFWSLAKVSIGTLYLLEKVLLKEDSNDLLDRIIAIQQEIVYVKEKRVDLDQHRYEEAFTDAYHFINEIIDKCSAVDNNAEKIAKHWRDILEKELEYEKFPERILPI